MNTYCMRSFQRRGLYEKIDGCDQGAKGVKSSASSISVSQEYCRYSHRLKVPKHEKFFITSPLIATVTVTG